MAEEYEIMDEGYGIDYLKTVEQEALQEIVGEFPFHMRERISTVVQDIEAYQDEIGIVLTDF